MDFAMMLKTYSGDVKYVDGLVRSFRRFNRDGVPLFLVAPIEDRSDFRALEGDDVRFIAEEELGHYLVSESVGGIRPGYVNQEIVKLAFWELGLSNNYLCVDSDLVFLRDFGISDFMAGEGVPYTFVTEDRELLVDRDYYETYWEGRATSIRAIQTEVGLDSDAILTCHNHQVFSTAVLKSFKENFLEPRGWSYRTAIEVAPYEFSWYNMWLQKTLDIPFMQREPIVKMIHTREQWMQLALSGTTEADIARGYAALVVNSNFSRQLGPVGLDGDRVGAIAFGLSWEEVARVCVRKVEMLARRLVRRLRRES